jgi:Beta-ketoacyl synthase, N-terminal domain
MIRVAIRGVGLWGPGLAGWDAARPVLVGAADWSAEDRPPPVPALLAPAERRRAGASVRLALTVAAEAVAGAGLAPSGIAGVFATSNGEGAVVGALLETLASDAPLVSPTRFHNSVHNAAAGYWTIAAGSHAPVTCLSGHDGSFAAGLLRAAAEVRGSAQPALLVAYDVPVPEPMAALRGTSASFAVALVLAPPGGDGAWAELALDYVAAPAIAARERPYTPVLRPLAAANPAARSLRLLQALAAGRTGHASLALFDGRVDVELRPCSVPTSSAR